jgi:hypothetical protein
MAMPWAWFVRLARYFGHWYCPGRNSMSNAWRLVKNAVVIILAVGILLIYLCVAIPHVILGMIRNMLDYLIDLLIKIVPPSFSKENNDQN